MGGQLDHVLWIGGGSGAGKSTVAAQLADEIGGLVYSTDEVMADHAASLDATEAPQLAAFVDMSMDERWLDRPVDEMFEAFHWFAGEGFQLIVDDLTAMPTGRPIVAEGFRLLPELVAPLLSDRAAAVWLLPTPEFRRRAFESRGSLWTIAGRTSDPTRALDRLLDRDACFTDRLRRNTARLGLAAIDVDESMSVHAVVRLVRATSRW